MVSLVGLVTLPLHQTTASPVQLNSVISAEALWRWLVRDTHSIPHPRFHSLVGANASLPPPTPSLSMVQSSHCRGSSQCPSTLHRAERSLLIARISSSWASAVLISGEGYVVTNAHLVRPYLKGGEGGAGGTLTTGVMVSHSTVPVASRRWYDAELVYCDTLWDLAVLRVEGLLPLMRGGVVAPVEGWRPPVTVGQRVYVLGHALFPPSSRLSPTLTRGVLSKVVHSTSAPVAPLLLQTDAAVHNGNSGGLLLSSSGDFLGLVTSNVLHIARPPLVPGAGSPGVGGGESCIIPHLNFSIPAEVVWRMVEWVKGGMREEERPRGWEGEGRVEVENIWALNGQEVWEVKERERSPQFKALVQRIQQMEEESVHPEQGSTQLQVHTLSLPPPRRLLPFASELPGDSPEHQQGGSRVRCRL